ncbi:hypothetical protein ANCDUO_10951 [Ancylostoma duodenale]|uniref:Uncharacterized protein n=1 Tax=Ancylostoma duodenale TaxID=51022 RepID=A0A0C2GIZ8_9BILA|nr:hypothetical protein ANCDUO_10951 [Ancylostoma duodenale]
MPVPSPPSAYAPPPPPTPGVVDCVGKSDGYYSNGCSPVFVFCSEGVATSMKTALPTSHQHQLCLLHRLLFPLHRFHRLFTPHQALQASTAPESLTDTTRMVVLPHSCTAVRVLPRRWYRHLFTVKKAQELSLAIPAMSTHPGVQ